MREQWMELEEFPEYAVNQFGDVTNMKRGMILQTSINQQGIVKVSLYKDRILFTRSVAVLVATAFVEPDNERFDTVIHLDGDRQNCRADNLKWRPRWFAIAYHKQFMFDNFHNSQHRLIEIESGETYHGLKEACVANGIHFQDIIKSFVEETFVPITYQEFRLIKE